MYFTRLLGAVPWSGCEVLQYVHPQLRVPSLVYVTVLDDRLYERLVVPRSHMYLQAYSKLRSRKCTVSGYCTAKRIVRLSGHTPAQGRQQAANPRNTCSKRLL